MKANILNLVLQRIAQGYEEQFPHYEAMLKLALEQETELQKEELDIDLLVEIINKRQEIIDLIEEQSANMNQLKEEVCKTLGIERFVLSEIKEKVDSQGIQELDQVVGELSQLLQKIRALDQKNEEMLRQRINETKAKLTAVQNTKKANEAYMPKKTSSEGMFIDFSK
ncbi:MAG: flagellar export chaperone FlgN [Peptococcia bacterium]